MSTSNVNLGCHNLEVGLSIELSMALSHALLTALHEAPCSGYDLAKKFDGTVGFFWSASHQQIYRELTKLEEQTYISAMVVQQSNRPDKKIYAVTEAGNDYLREWIARPSTVAAIKDELLVKLFAGDLVEPAVILAELEHHRSQHQELLDTYKSIEQRFFANACQLDVNRRYQYLTLRQGIRLETEWLAWCAEAIESFD
jgi:DNA-binding PadR family transcriptional regulator